MFSDFETRLKRGRQCKVPTHLHQIRVTRGAVSPTSPLKKSFLAVNPLSSTESSLARRIPLLPSCEALHALGETWYINLCPSDSCRSHRLVRAFNRLYFIPTALPIRIRLITKRENTLFPVLARLNEIPRRAAPLATRLRPSVTLAKCAKFTGFYPL